MTNKEFDKIENLLDYALNELTNESVIMGKLHTLLEDMCDNAHGGDMASYASEALEIVTPRVEAIRDLRMKVERYYYHELPWLDRLKNA